MKNALAKSCSTLALSVAMALASTASWAGSEREGRQMGQGPYRAIAGLQLDQAQRETVQGLIAEHRERSAALGRDHQARQAEREALLADIRAVLDPAQREVFDSRLAERRARRAEGGHGHLDGERGRADGRGRYGERRLQQLDLSVEQREAIRELVQQHRDKVSDQRDELRAAIRAVLDERQQGLWDAMPQRGWRGRRHHGQVG